MAFEEYVKRAILSGRTYDDLPARVKAMLPLAEWRAKVREFCIQRGYPWATSAARHVCGQQEYYDELLSKYKAWGRIFPYHLAEYVCRVQRETPFKYYKEVLYLTLREERSYDTIPNFTAADALRVLGVGRNEYIAIMNACKAKKIMWRVNKALAKDLLPQAEKDVRLEPWWLVCVANVSESEYRELSSAESDLLRSACDARRGVPPASAFDAALLRRLHRAGLVYLDVPISPGDRFSIPPLEGFVSNKTADASDSAADPIESLLYSAFVASSERLTLAEVAGILNVPIEELQVAMSVACRLGFATRLAPASPGPGPPSPLLGPAGGAPPPRLPSGALGPGGGELSIPDDLQSAASNATTALSGLTSPAPGSAGAGAAGGGAAVAVVVDADATSYLMMGALSPGLKRHSVSLFEGGRVSGAGVVEEMVRELWASYEAGQGFEGDMLRLTNYAAALATLLEAVSGGAPGAALELVRKESLEGLDPAAASKVMARSYFAVVPIAPLPGAPLPLSPFRAGPAHYGPTPEAASPWLQLALYAESRLGPVSLAIAAGQRLWRLPPQLEHCSHALMWGWSPDARPAADTQPMLVEGGLLLASLNDLLARTAVLVQPLLYNLPVAATGASSGVSGGGAAVGDGEEGWVPSAEFADVALPVELPPDVGTSSSSGGGGGGGGGPGSSGGGRGVRVRAVHRRTGQHEEVALPASVAGALRRLGLDRAVGYLRVMRVQAEPPGKGCAVEARAEGGGGRGGDGGGGAPWLPLAVHFGVPLHTLQLCRDVCGAAGAAGFLSACARAAHEEANRALQARLWRLAAQHGAPERGAVVHAGADAAAAGSGGGAEGEGGWVAAAMGELAGCAELPAVNLLFDGTNLTVLDLSEEGGCTLCAA